MPRIVRNCRTCTLKFIAKDFVHDLTCTKCQPTEDKQENDDPPIETTIDDDIQDFDAGISSEAEDDFHCTQIVELLSSDDDNVDNDEDDEDDDDNDDEVEEEDEDEPLTSLIRITPHQPQQRIIHNPYSPSKSTSPNLAKEQRLHISISLDPQKNEQKHKSSQQLTTCLVCGANLMETIQSGWKGRMDHIKRCSKKHGVQAKDVIEQPDEEFIIENSTRDNDWCNGSNRSSQRMQQTTLLSLLPSERKQPSAPPNALTMLMDGARRVAQQAKQPKELKQSRTQTTTTTNKNTNAKKRQWSSGPKYSSRTCPFYKKIPGTDFGKCHWAGKLSFIVD
jgi:hypothetical protein